MEDARYFYVYENQRWNPLTGFTSHGLPTDRYKRFWLVKLERINIILKFISFNRILTIHFRYSWSDRSGRLSLTKDMVKLPSIHWQWVSASICLKQWELNHFFSRRINVYNFDTYINLGNWLVGGLLYPRRCW